MENNDERITKTEDNFAGGQYECEEKIGFSDQKLPFANKPVQNMAPYSPVDQSDCTWARCGKLGWRLRYPETKSDKRHMQVIDHREYKPTVPRHSSSFHHLVPFMEVSPSNKITAQAGCSSNSGEEPLVPARFQNSTTPNMDRSSRRNKNSPGSFERSSTSSENRYAVGHEGHVYQVVSAVLRSSSQPDVSQSKECHALWRLRRVGVSRGTENTAAMNDRVKARVLMKKFGELNIYG